MLICGGDTLDVITRRDLNGRLNHIPSIIFLTNVYQRLMARFQRYAHCAFKPEESALTDTNDLNPHVPMFGHLADTRMKVTYKACLLSHHGPIMSYWFLFA